MKLALFDLDHTLLPIDSDHSWGEFTIDLGWHDAATFRERNDAFYAHYQAGTLDIHEYVRFATEAACVRGPVEAAKAHNRYMDEVIRPRILPEALDLVRSHQRAGDDRDRHQRVRDPTDCAGFWRERTDRGGARAQRPWLDHR